MGTQGLTLSTPSHDSDQMQRFDEEALEETATTSASLFRPSCPRPHGHRRAHRARTHQSDAESW